MIVWKRNVVGPEMRKRDHGQRRTQNCVTRNWVGSGNAYISGTKQGNQTKLGNRRKDRVRDWKPFRWTVKIGNQVSDGDSTFLAEIWEVDRKVVLDRR